MLKTALGFFFVCILTVSSFAQQGFKTDTIATSKGDLLITFIGHASLMFRFDNHVIDIDPVSKEADYSRMPKADMILVTHEHPDHFDPKAIDELLKKTTVVILTKTCAKVMPGRTIMGNGDIRTIDDIRIAAFPAYNIVHKRPNGQPYHPKGRGNGYVLTFGNKRVYVAGDTENIPEMKALGKIDIAFLPMNLPYTMTPQMVAAAAKVIKPKILYPYHYGNTDPSKLVELLKNDHNIQVRIRKMR